jgi:hypothetical protein
MAQEANGPAPRTQVPEVHFTVSGQPGFIPAGVKVTGVQRGSMNNLGFIPARSEAAVAVAAAAVKVEAVIVPTGVCDLCGKDFRKKRNPRRSVVAHKQHSHQ